MRFRSWPAVVCCCGVFAQSAPKFEAVEIRASGPNTVPRMRNGFSRGRYEFGNATLVDMIRTAWSVDADTVVGGPDWLDADRFDVMAMAPAGSTPDELRTMLRAMLAERFQLVVHNGIKDAPTYAMTAGSEAQLKEASGTEESGCKTERRTARDPFLFTCRNMTMGALADSVPRMAGSSGYSSLIRWWIRPGSRARGTSASAGCRGSWGIRLRCSRRWRVSLGSRCG
jgi:uncharacterized protein (TIGR03435 family)